MNHLTLIPIEELRTILAEVINENLNAKSLTAHQSFDEYPELLTRKQVAKLLGVCLASIDNWSNTGRLKKIRIGRSVRFSKEEVIASMGTLGKYHRL